MQIWKSKTKARQTAFFKPRKMLTHSWPVPKCIQLFFAFGKSRRRKYSISISARVESKTKARPNAVFRLRKRIRAASGRPCLLGCLCFVTVCKQINFKSKKEIFGCCATNHDPTYTPGHAKCICVGRGMHLATVVLYMPVCIAKGSYKIFHTAIDLTPGWKRHRPRTQAPDAGHRPSVAACSAFDQDSGQKLLCAPTCSTIPH